MACSSTKTRQCHVPQQMRGNVVCLCKSVTMACASTNPRRRHVPQSSRDKHNVASNARCLYHQEQNIRSCMRCRNIGVWLKLIEIAAPNYKINSCIIGSSNIVLVCSASFGQLSFLSLLHQFVFIWECFYRRCC